jgi:hypothetical protein
MDREHALQELTHRLLTYFGTVGAPRFHLFTLSEINLQVMMNSYAAKERDLLAIALAGLVADRDLLAMSPTSYNLTDQGMLRVRLLRPSAFASA